jgi:hypothetical protein
LESKGEHIQQFHGSLHVSDQKTSNEGKELMINRLNGIGAGPAETAQPTIIADVIFLHDRGKYQTLYFAFYFGSLMVNPSLP